MFTYKPANTLQDSELSALSQKIVPVHVNASGVWRCPPVDIFMDSFLHAIDFDEQFEEDIVPLREIVTYHPFKYAGFFNPTIASVLRMIPEDLLPHVVAFETFLPDVNAYPQARNASWHVATTRLYRAPKK